MRFAVTKLPARNYQLTLVWKIVKGLNSNNNDNNNNNNKEEEEEEEQQQQQQQQQQHKFTIQG